MAATAKKKATAKKPAASKKTAARKKAPEAEARAVRLVNEGRGAHRAERRGGERDRRAATQLCGDLGGANGLGPPPRPVGLSGAGLGGLCG